MKPIIILSIFWIALTQAPAFGGYSENASGKPANLSLSVNRSSLTDEEQRRVLQLFAEHEPKFPQFGTVFPNASLRIFREVYPPEEAGRIRIDANVKFEETMHIALWFSIKFNTELTKVIESRCIVFQIIDMHDAIKPGIVEPRFKLTLDDMDEFCSNPIIYIAKRNASKSKSP